MNQVNIKLPKLSYVLLAHNREQYIKEAIESAFAQEYEGELEYIFSDDSSTDNTYAIMKKCVEAYQGGRRVVLTQTPCNGHLAAHTNHAVSFVESDWIVRADDDDYSRIDRCAIIGRAIAEHPQCRFVVTGLSPFTDETAESAKQESLVSDSENCRYRYVHISKGYKPLGSHKPTSYSYKAWHMDVFRRFGPLSSDAYYVDDLTCYFRANLIGGGVYVDNAPVVYVRNGSGNMCRGGDDNSGGYSSIVRLERFNDKYYNITYRPLFKELHSYRDYVSGCVDDTSKDEINKYIESLEADLKKRNELQTFWRKGVINRFILTRKYFKLNIFGLCRCLPLPIFAGIQASFRYFKNILRRK